MKRNKWAKNKHLEASARPLAEFCCMMQSRENFLLFRGSQLCEMRKRGLHLLCKPDQAFDKWLADVDPFGHFWQVVRTKFWQEKASTLQFSRFEILSVENKFKLNVFQFENDKSNNKLEMQPAKHTPWSFMKASESAPNTHFSLPNKSNHNDRQTDVTHKLRGFHWKQRWFLQHKWCFLQLMVLQQCKVCQQPQKLIEHLDKPQKNCDVFHHTLQNQLHICVNITSKHVRKGMLAHDEVNFACSFSRFHNNVSLNDGTPNFSETSSSRTCQFLVWVSCKKSIPHDHQHICDDGKDHASARWQSCWQQFDSFGDFTMLCNDCTSDFQKNSKI